MFCITCKRILPTYTFCIVTYLLSLHAVLSTSHFSSPHKCPSLPSSQTGMRTGTAIRPKQGPSRLNSVRPKKITRTSKSKTTKIKKNNTSRRNHRSIEPQILQGRVERGEPLGHEQGVRSMCGREICRSTEEEEKRSIAPPTANGPRPTGYVNQYRVLFYAALAQRKIAPGVPVLIAMSCECFCRHEGHTTKHKQDALGLVRAHTKIKSKNQECTIQE